MYSIYRENQLPDLDDGLDEIAAHQRAVSLLQRIQDDDPDLWKTITNLPDGIRSALRVAGEPQFPDNGVHLQGALEIDGSQMPLVSPGEDSSTVSPFDPPRAGETLVLLSVGDVKGCYAVAGDLQPRPISPSQFVAAAECERDTPAQELPDDTNERVMAAFETFKSDFARRLGRARRPRDTQARRYVSRRLRMAMNEVGQDASERRRIEDLRRIFQGDLTEPVESALGEIRNLRLEGSALRTRLDALRERYRLNPPDDSDQPQAREPQVIRIVCSDGLV